MTKFTEYSNKIGIQTFSDSLVISQIKNDIEDYLSNFLFEINDKQTQDVIVNQLCGYLEEVKNRTKAEYEISIPPSFEEPLNWIEEVFGRLYPQFPRLEVSVRITPKESLESIQLNFKVE
jgi:hypothetical protein